MFLNIKVRDFDFQKIFDSGLFYFFYEEGPKRVIHLNGRFIELKFWQDQDYLKIQTSERLDFQEKEFLVKRVKKCFGLEEDLSEFYKICSKDKVLGKYLDRIKESRILSAFTDFEALVGAVISQNNSYRNYRKQMNRVYKELNFIEGKFEEEKLRELGVGYKAQYLTELARSFGKIDIEKIRGIGNYSINLFRIFQLRDYNSFYVDCLVEKIFREEYGIESNFEEASRKLFGKWRGLAVAYLQRFFEVK